MNMYKSARRFSVLKRILEDGVLLSPKKVSGLNTIRSYAGPKQEEGKEQVVIPFREMLKLRHTEASRSMLIEVENQNSCEDLFEYVRRFGKIKKMYHYTNKENSHYVLVEMSNEAAFTEVLRNAQSVQGLVGGSSNFLWFKPSKSKVEKKHNGNNKYPNMILNASVQAVENHSKFDFFDDVKSLGTKMVQFYKKSRIDDLGFRLRFLICKQMEEGTKSISSSIHVLPFGSSVNGFGNKGGDLDMVAIADIDANKSPSRLVYHGKKYESERSMEQTHLFIINHIIKHILPGCVDAILVPNAKVPIIKYYQKHTSLDCDLSLYRRDSVIMSELLYFLASIDPRVRPLVYFIRLWAKTMTLTNDTPGKWITNFQLSLLVMFFLQQKNENGISLLPPVQVLQLERDHLMSNEVFENLRATYQNHASENKQSLEELLLKFFQFYSNFDFNLYGVSLRSGEVFKKLTGHNHKTIYIENPLSPELNVAKNVFSTEVSRIQDCFTRAFTTLSRTWQKDEIDALSYLKINELVEPDHKREMPEVVKNLDQEKYDKSSSHEHFEVRETQAINDRSLVKKQSGLKDDVKALMDEMPKLVENLDKGKYDSSFNEDFEVRDRNDRNLERKQSALKLNFKNLMNET